jgi:hypothetical protein
VTIAFYLFLVAMYAGQRALYRTSFPTNMRYDFPAMLLIPAVCCLTACDVSRRIRERQPEAAANYAQLVAAACILFAVASVNLSATPLLLTSVRTNIDATTTFFDEIGRDCRGSERKSFGAYHYRSTQRVGL